MNSVSLKNIKGNMAKRVLMLVAAVLFSAALSAQTYIRDAEYGDANAQYRLGKMNEGEDR